MAKRTCLAVVLAAGEGTRMRSDLPKVMHKVGGLPMLGHVLTSARAAGAGSIGVVVGPGKSAVPDFVARTNRSASVFTQRERLGTAHAVLLHQVVEQCIQQAATTVVHCHIAFLGIWVCFRGVAAP